MLTSSRERSVLVEDVSVIRDLLLCLRGGGRAVDARGGLDAVAAEEALLVDHHGASTALHNGVRSGQTGQTAAHDDHLQQTHNRQICSDQ